MRWIFLLCVLSALVVPQIAGTEPAAEELSGSVVLPDGEPAVGATVRIVENAPDGNRVVVVTGDDGTFHIDGIGGAKFSVRIEAASMAPAIRIDVLSGSNLEFTLEPGERLKGLVFDKKTGAVVQGATLQACDAHARRFGNEACSRIRSDDDGAFRFNELAAGPTTVTAYSSHHSRAESSTVIVPEKCELLELYLDPGGRISGSISGPDDSTLDDLDVWLLATGPTQRDRNFVPRLERPGTDGSFGFAGVPLGRHFHLRVESDGFARKIAGPFKIDQGTHVSNLILQVDRGASVQFRLVDEDDRAVPISNLRLEPEGEAFWKSLTLMPDRLDVDAKGNHVARHLPAGLFGGTIASSNLAPIDIEEFQLQTGETTDLGTIVAPVGETIAGRVTDTQGRGVEANLSAFFGSGQQRDTRSGRDGRYRLIGLTDEPVKWIVVGSARGFLPVRVRDVETGRDDVDIVLERAATVIGRVVTFTGEPPDAYNLRAYEEAGNETPGRPERVDYPRLHRLEEGHFKLSRLAPGKYTILGTAENWAPARKTGVVIVEGQEIDVGVLQLEQGLVLEGQVVTGRDGTPVGGAGVEIFDSGRLMLDLDSEEGAPHVDTGPDGRFLFRGLEPGRLQVVVQHPGFSSARLEATIDKERAAEELEIRLSAGGTLTGNVTDGDGLPAAGVSVTAIASLLTDRRLPKHTETDADGRYTIKRLAEGTYSVLRIDRDRERAGFSSKQATIVEGEVTVVDFNRRSRIKVSGRVLRGDEPIAANLLFAPRRPNLFNFSVGSIKTTSAGGDGKYAIGLDSPGTYQVMVDSTDGTQFGSEAVEIVIPDEEVVQRDIVLSTTSVSGVVSDTRGRPVGDATVQATVGGADPMDITGGALAYTDGSGRYEMRGLEAGTYVMSASAEGLLGAEKPSVSISDGANMLDFVLERGRILRGRVLDPGGNPVPDAGVMIGPAARPLSSYYGSTNTDLNGAFEINAPHDGAVDVSVVSLSWAPGLLSGVDLSSLPDDYEAVVRLSRGGTIVATLVGADGAPIAGTQVLAMPLTETLAYAVVNFILPSPGPSNAQGIIRIERLPQGSYTLQVAGRQDVQSVAVEVIDGDVHEITMQIP